MTTNAVFLAILGFFKRVLLSVRQKKGFRQFEKRSAPFFSSPPQTFFSKTLLFLFSLVFFFFSVVTFNIPCFFSSTPFQILFSFCFFGLMNRPLWKTCLENTFSYHRGLRGGTWEDGPQSAVFSACLHPEFNINLCYKRSGIDKRVVFQEGGFGGQDPWLALGLLLFGFLSPFDLEKPWLFFFVIHQIL